jgi:phospholipid transport system substrate-binding protein
MKTIKLFLFSMLIIFVINIAYATTQTAEEIVKTTSDQVIARLITERAELEAHPEKIYSLINELVIPHFDFVSMSKWVLGKTNWNNSNKDQKDNFVSEFRTLLVRTYAKALLEYSDHAIKYYPVESNPDSNIAVVRTEIQQPGANVVPINYSMHVSGGEWKVVDVAVDGISLVATYRGSFASEIRKNGMDALISKLAERNAQATNLAAQ